MNRRETLKFLGLLAAGTGVLTTACNNEGGKSEALTGPKQLPGVQDFEHERNQKLYAEKFFDEHEMATITVLVDIIIPKDDISGSASEAGVPDFIEFIVKDLPDNKIPMRGGIKWLDVQCQKRYNNLFVNCSEEQQLEIVDAIAYPNKVKPELKQGAAFFSLLRNLTASGFYTTEMGVKDIGYVGNRPGVWNGVPEDIMREHGFDPEKFFG